MSIYFEKSTGKFRVEVMRNGKRKRGRATTMEAAQSLEDDLIDGVEREKTVTDMSVSVFLEHALKEGLWEGLASRQTYILHIKQFSRLVQNPLMPNITTRLIDEYIGKLDNPATQTVNNKLSALSSLLKWAASRNYIEAMPVIPWRKRELDAGRIRWLTYEEEDQLLALLPEDVRAFCIVALDTGLRRSEIHNLDLPDCIHGDWLRVWRTKNGKPRSIPLTKRATEALDFMQKYGIPGKSAIRWFWDIAKKEMGLEHDKEFVLHALRHTAATRMVQANLNLEVVREFMGHSSILTTQRYSHVSNDQLKEAVKGLER